MAVNADADGTMNSEEVRAKKGDVVLFHYVGKDDEGLIFDTTRGEPPLRTTLGKGEVLPAIESALKGMAVGESKVIFIPFSEAYGPLRSELVIEVPKRNLPPHIHPKIGMHLKIPLKRLTKPLKTTVLAVNEFSITLDANHPLAGKNLTYEIELMSIEKPAF